MSSVREWSTLPSRLSLGATMLHHGGAKLRDGGLEQTASMFDSLGIRPARTWAAATAVAELFAGASALLGIGTRLAALAVLVTQSVAIAKVHAGKGFDNSRGGFEFNLALVAMAVGLLVTGPGAGSVYGWAQRRWPVRGFLRARPRPWWAWVQ